jgi:hypothetical protein
VLFLCPFLCSHILPVTVAVLQLRRERIAERMKALQELVPNANKVRSIAYTIIFEKTRERRDCKSGLGFWCWEMIDAGNKGSPITRSEFVPRKARD